MTNLTLTTPLKVWEDGTIRVENSRVTLDSIVRQFKLGSTAEQIQEDFPSLSLREIYAVLAFYLEQTDFVEDYLKKQKAESQKLIEFIEQNLPTQNLRASIRARQRELQNR
jgi:uncharacterized protein (DUF433 family)